MLNCMQSHLSHADIDQIDDFKRAKVSVDVSTSIPEELISSLKPGIIFCSCSDGKRFRDAWKFLDTALMHHADEVHSIQLDGGAQAGPLSEFEFMKKRVEIGLMKGYRTLFILGHAPCLACHLEHKSIFEAVKGLFEMKELLKQHFSDLKIVIFFQVDYRETKKADKGLKTYHLCRKAWLEYIDHATK